MLEPAPEVKDMPGAAIKCVMLRVVKDGLANALQKLEILVPDLMLKG